MTSANATNLPTSFADESDRQRRRRRPKLPWRRLVRAALSIGIVLMLRPGPAEAAWLVWDYPPQLLSTGLTFHVVHAGAVNVPLTNWVPLVSIVGTNTQVQVQGQSTNHFFGVIASNVHGSFFCDAPCLNPATVQPVQGVRILKDP